MLRMTEEDARRHLERVRRVPVTQSPQEAPAEAPASVSFFVPSEPQGKASPRAVRMGSVPIDKIIAAYEQTGSVYKAGKLLGIHGSSLHERLQRAGHPIANNRFRPDEIERIRREYESAALDYRLDELAKAMGRTKTGICRIAGLLGMTDMCRKMPARKVLESSARAKAMIARNGHPRGALGMKHTDKTKGIISMKASRMWADPSSKVNTDEHRQKLSDRCVQMTIDREKPVGYTRCAGGKRADLNDTYFRSSWEANYARYLNFLKGKGEIHDWEFECTTFVFETIKRGTRTYTPDFRVWLTAERAEWHEVKGWMDPKSKTRMARMARYFPTEKIVVIDATWFKSAVRTGLPSMLPGWEFKASKRQA